MGEVGPLGSPGGLPGGGDAGAGIQRMRKNQVIKEEVKKHCRGWGRRACGIALCGWGQEKEARSQVGWNRGKKAWMGEGAEAAGQSLLNTSETPLKGFQPGG